MILQAQNKLIDDGAMVATKPIHLAAPYAEKFDTVDLSKVKSVEHYMMLQVIRAPIYQRRMNLYLMLLLRTEIKE